MNLSTLLSEVKTALGGISGLYVFDTVPERVTPPAAVIVLGEFRYQPTFDPAPMDVALEVTVLVARTESGYRQTDLHGYIAPTGATSVKAAIEDGTYTQGVNVRVTGGSSPQDIDLGGTSYIGVVFAVEALS